MVELIGLYICVPLYTAGWLLFGPTFCAAVFLFHIVIVPSVFRFSKLFRRHLIFGNYVQWPLYPDYENPASSGVKGGRNLYVEFDSKVDHCPIRLGVWHIVPASTYERLKRHFEVEVDRDELDTILDRELADSKTPIVLYCHGNSNSRLVSHRIKLYKFFQSQQYHTIAFDYRGYGDATNVTPSEVGVVEDALRVYEWLQNKLKLRRHEGTPAVFVWGHSLGTAIASHMLGNLEVLSRSTLERPPLPAPSGLILEAPFNNLADEVANIPIAKLVSWLPYFERWFVCPFRSPLEATFRSDHHLRRVTTLPALILHAKDDLVVPFVCGLKLYRCIVESRSLGDATVRLHAYEKQERRGHKWICEANDLSLVVGDFVTSQL